MLTFHEVIQLVDQLSPVDRAALMHYLQATLPLQPVTRESLFTELERRRAAGLFEHTQSLRNKYANPSFDLSDDELRTGLDEFANEWEKDLDDLG